jgi:hypothetical protein
LLDLPLTPARRVHRVFRDPKEPRVLKVRVFREPRAPREPKGHREPKVHRELRVPREPKVLRVTREPKEPKAPKVLRGHREPREPREPKAHRELKVPKDTQVLLGQVRLEFKAFRGVLQIQVPLGQRVLAEPMAFWEEQDTRGTQGTQEPRVHRDMLDLL